MRWGLKGKGAWITVFTNPGHAYAVIAGLRLDTSVGRHVRRARQGRRRLSAFESGPRWRPMRALRRAASSKRHAALLLAPSTSTGVDRARGRIRLGLDPNAEVAVPGLGGRMSTVIKAKINKMLDKAEDPSETLEYSYAKQMELLQNVKKGIADVVTAKKRLQLQQQKLEQQVVKLDTQARQALAAGKEDLARTALERKQFAQTELQTLDQQVAELEEQQQGLIDKEQKLRSKLEQFRTKKEVIKAQYSAAEAQVKISEAATGVGEEMADVGLAMQRAMDKTEGMRARASAMEELEAAGAFDDNLTLTAGQDDIDRQLAELTSGSQVDDDLAKMKAELGQGSAPSPALEEGTPADQQARAASSDRPDRDGGPVPPARRDAERLNELDNEAVAAVEADDEDRFHEVFEEMLELVRTDGHKLGEDELEESDVILPPPDLSFAEAEREFTGEGLIPD